MPVTDWDDAMSEPEAPVIVEIHDRSERRPSLRNDINIVELNRPIRLEDGEPIKWFGITDGGRRLIIWPFLDDDSHNEYHGNYGFNGHNVIISSSNIVPSEFSDRVSILREYISLRQRGIDTRELNQEELFSDYAN